jgi:hypothetical protein
MQYPCTILIFLYATSAALKVAHEVTTAARKFSLLDPLHAGGPFQRTASQRVTFAQSASVVDELETDTSPQINTKNRAIVGEFVKRMGGKRVLQRILIANNGMAATKAILSMRQWAYMVLGTLHPTHERFEPWYYRLHCLTLL